MPKTNKAFEPQKETLINIALDIFIEYGYEQTTMTQLRKAFNLSVGGMYHYFSSKEEILDAIIQHGLQQAVEEVRGKLLEIPIEKKLYYFISDSSANDFAMKLYQYKDDNKNSLVAYKLREQNVSLFIPLVIEVFEESINIGLYKTEFPEELAEFSMLLAKAIFEASFLPEGNLEKRKRRVDALLHIFKTAMKAPEYHLKKLRLAFYFALESQHKFLNSKINNMEKKQ